jgi:hypothetical protein
MCAKILQSFIDLHWKLNDKRYIWVYLPLLFVYCSIKIYWLTKKVLVYKATPSAMKKWPYKRGGLYWGDSGLIRGGVSIEGGSGLIRGGQWPYQRGGLYWGGQWPYKRGGLYWGGQWPYKRGSLYWGDSGLIRGAVSIEGDSGLIRGVVSFEGDNLLESQYI